MADDGHDHEKMSASTGGEVQNRNAPPDSHAHKPVIFAVDAGAESFPKIEYGLRRRYGVEYRVICETSALWGFLDAQDVLVFAQDQALHCMLDVS